MTKVMDYMDSFESQMLAVSGILVVVGGTMIIAPTVTKLGTNIFLKGFTKAFLMYSAARSKYRWKLRLKTPDVFRHVGDKFFKLDHDTASIDSPRNLAESIKVVSATVKKSNMCIDVVDKVNKALQELTESGTVILQMDQLAPSPDLLGFDDCSLEVVYIGHADPSKRIPAAEFGVKYKAKVCSGIVFPPYKVTDKIQKGFSTSKILHARTFHEKNLTPLAKKYAGLKANFYKDVVDPRVQKDHIDHKQVHVLLSENGNAPTTIMVTRR